MKKKTSSKENLFILLAILIMGILFYSSSQPYSKQTVAPMLETLLKNEPLKDLLSTVHFNYAGSEVSIATKGYSHFVEFFIRKGAHFGTYFLLGLFWFLGLKGKMRSTELAFLISWLLAAGYAAFDEFHQSFTAERTPLFQDVILDSVGALTGILMVYLFVRLRKNRKRK
ncbi:MULTISPECIES: VanZ family protein [Carnobacterium]|uniref:VanZ-like domain-containing protein n=1 Tax=Carnobacterium divergens TaxID=2748 RepID=A0A5F0N0F8_CARDV|nr:MULTISPECIES: VanZ family protein [Carnobacterium]MDT1939299.1 VanZ family protein [Carnobacterium divergens]MDT1941737.1 VanZ family protein [Carnobacterium divergens]MDT1947535.1 VanZ family protein [Carnobacterium divergens]MDT1949974.1 VanZ family protein [Carnobacterium divergens]MDT1955152.1 VanZ family protein [Carnobacterium divergens]